jgi:hypothetical protein
MTFMLRAQLSYNAATFDSYAAMLYFMAYLEGVDELIFPPSVVLT